MRVIITGLVGQYPFGGVIWDYLQYLLGFRALGHEVLYLEDSGAWPYDPEAGTITDDCSFALKSLKRIFGNFGLTESWVYRNGADGKFHGAGEKTAREWLRHGDLLVNVSSAGWLRDYDLRVGHRMFIDGDPMFCQIGLLDGSDPLYAGRLRDHDSHFTFGLSVGQPDCPVPVDGIAWKPTVQPVVLEQWPQVPVPPSAPWTTVMNWASYKPKIWEGRPYGQKDLEFEKFSTLPERVKTPLRIAMGMGVDGKRPAERLRKMGWDLVEPQEGCRIIRRTESFYKTRPANGALPSTAMWPPGPGGSVVAAPVILPWDARLLLRKPGGAGTCPPKPARFRSPTSRKRRRRWNESPGITTGIPRPPGR